MTKSFLLKISIFFSVALFIVSCADQESEGENDESPLSLTESEKGLIDSLLGETVPSSGDYQTLSGRPFSLTDIQGDKAILLNYWATWCAPCIREIPSLLNAQVELGEDYLVLLASDESLEDIQIFVDEHQFEGSFIKLNVYFADHDVQAIPSTYLYGADGQELGNWLGAFEWDSPEVIAELQLLIQPTLTVQ